METRAEHYERLLGLDGDWQVLDVELVLGWPLPPLIPGKAEDNEPAEEPAPKPTSNHVLPIRRVGIGLPWLDDDGAVHPPLFLQAGVGVVPVGARSR